MIAQDRRAAEEIAVPNNDASLQMAIAHGFTEAQWRAAKSIERAIFGPYQWQNQGDRAASMFVRILDALRECEQKAREEERERCAKVADEGADPRNRGGEMSFVVVPKNGQTWIICGGRDFHDAAMFDNAMADILDIKGCPERIVHGDARGADQLADAWARRMAIDVRAMPAPWEFGKAAGPIRNQGMIDVYHPEFVIAFPGGKGTADMVKRARKHGIAVCEVKQP